MMITPGRNETKNEKNGREVKPALSGVRKPRFKWTVEVHKRFVDAVNQLGGIYSEYKLLHFACLEYEMSIAVLC